jgi:hypothetical protein
MFTPKTELEAILRSALDKRTADLDAATTEIARLHTIIANALLANTDMAETMAGMQGELAEARAALAFVVKVTPLDVLRNEARFGLVNMQLVDAAFQAAAAFLAAQPQEETK